MGLFSWIRDAVEVAKDVVDGVKWVVDKVKKGIKYLTGGYDPDGDDIKSNAKFHAALTKLRNDMQSDIEKSQQKKIEKVKSDFEQLFMELVDRFEDMDISRLESMLNDTIEKNQAKVDEIIKDEVSIDNDELREIAKIKSKEDRDKKYDRFFDYLTLKIESQQRKNIRKLYNETLNNAHDAYDEEFEKKRSILDKQIKDISRMIADNDNQSESEEVLIDNIQKKIICQMAIDAVESVN